VADAFTVAGAVVAPASRGAPDIDPVGRPVAAAGEPVLLDEGLQQQRGVPVAGPKILLHLTGRPGKELAGQIRDPNPGQDEKSAVVEDPLSPLVPLPAIPAYPPVPRLQREGGRAKADGADHAAIGMDQLADLGAGKRDMTEIVVTVYQPVPE